MGDRVRSLVVGHGLEHELALHLEHVADFVEDAASSPFERIGGVSGASIDRMVVAGDPNAVRSVEWRAGRRANEGIGRLTTILLGHVRVPGLHDPITTRSLGRVESPVGTLHDVLDRLAGALPEATPPKPLRDP